MANIRKSFNFKNGVAVDDDDLIVRGSLVGIGTSVPSEILDVRGTLKVVGTTTTRDLFSVGIATFNELTIAGTAITMNRSGIITAKEFYGNGATLLNLPTSQWQDVDVGLGFTSIYAVGNIGIATRDPRYVLHVGQVNLWQAGDLSKAGIGINSQGGVISSGIMTAFSFVGFGSNLQLIDADNIDLGTLDNDRLPIIRNDRFAPNINISGIITAGDKFSGVLLGDVVGIASTALGLSGNPDIYVGFISATSIRATSIEITGDVANPIPGISTIGGRLDIGLGGTAFTVNSNRRVGIGVSQPTKNLQIDNKIDTFVEVASSVSGPAIIAIGSSITGGTGNLAGFLRYGDTPGEFDIYNKSPGNFNFLLHAGNAGINTQRFNWLNGQTFANLMSLTYDARLGIGLTNPARNLHVVGTSTVTGNAFFGGNVFTNGTITVQGTILGDPTSTLTQNLYVTSGISTVNNLHVASRLGITTSNPSCGLDAKNETAVFGTIGVGLTSGAIGNNNKVRIEGNLTLTQDSSVGIGTTQIYNGTASDGSPGSNVNLGALQVWGRPIRVEGQADILIGRNGLLGIGSYNPIGAIDARYATYSSSVRAPAYMPVLTTAERGGLNSIVQESALIYNDDDSAFQFWNGSAWITLQGSGSGSFSTLSVTTTSSFGGLLDANGGATIDNIRIGVAGDNEIDTSTGNLTIDSNGGTTTIDDILSVSGATTLSSTLTVTSTATFNGDVDLGNATTDTISFTGRVDTDILPSTDNARDLGSTLRRWNQVYAAQFVGDGSGLTGIVAAGSGVVIEDDGSPVGTAATINFGTNLTATIAGGVATINASGGGGVSVGGTWGITSSGDVGITTVKAVGVKTDVLSSSFMVQQFGIESKAGTFTASAGVPSTIDSIGVSTFNFRTAEYTLYFEWNGNIQAQKVLCMQNGTTAYSQEYAVMSDPNTIVSVGTTISGGNFQLQATPEAGVSGVTTYTWTRHTVIRT